MGDIVSGVSSYANTDNALGYSVYYYLANMYAVVRADEPAGGPARRVMEWLLTPEGQQAVVDAGYVPAAK